MGDSKYIKWSALVDAESCGRRLTDAEQAFCEQVVSESPAAAAELELIEHLLSARGAVPDSAARALVDRALDTVEAQELGDRIGSTDEAIAGGRAQQGPRFWLAISTGAALAMAATWMLWPRPVAAPIHTQGTPSFRTELVYASGDVRVEETLQGVGAGVLSAGQVVQTGIGHACLVMEPGIDMCTGENTRLRVRAPSANDRGIDLLAGSVTAALQSQPAGTHFSIVAGNVVATAMGTVFAVAYGKDDGVVTTVSEGLVRVEAPEGQRLVRAHERVSHYRDGKVRGPEPVPRMEEARLRGTVGIADLWRDGLSATVELDGPKDGKALLDGRSLGRLPVVTVVPSGTHTVGLLGEEPQTIRIAAGERARVKLSRQPANTAPVEAFGNRASAGDRPQAASVGDGRHTRAWKVVPAATARLAGQATEPEPPVNAGGLLRTAQGHALAHRFGAAAKAYQTLRTEHATTPEAHAGLVALGELQLTRLGKPAVALETFGSYLSRGGPMTPEAMHGRVRALAALGRPEAERRAIELFIWRYPSSPHRQALERRAKELAAAEGSADK